jgi:perosamine synthetase
MTPFRIPVYRPDLSGNEQQYVMECMQSSWISSKGKFIGEFEERFSQRIGVRHATTVSNGTVALHVALLALGIGPGDEVIVPTLTYIATANAVSYCGATPVFVDSEPGHWQIDPADVQRKITAKTKAVIAVHLYGHPCAMDELMALCRQHNLFLVEDCAEAIGTMYRHQHVGTFGDISTFSFFGNKTMTTGEGGMVVTNDRTLFDRARHFKGQGLAAHREYWHDVVGYNYRMTNLCAAIGVAQLERVDAFIERKKRIAALYRSGLRGTPLAMHAESPDGVHSHWMVTVLVECPDDRDALRAHLSAAGIETRPVFYPIHTMPMYSSRYQRHRVAEDIAWRGINLPSFPSLTDAEVREVCTVIRGFYQAQLTVTPLPVAQAA